MTNAADLAAAFGLPGAVAYGTYWLSIPVAVPSPDGPPGGGSIGSGRAVSPTSET